MCPVTPTTGQIQNKKHDSSHMRPDTSSAFKTFVKSTVAKVLDPSTRLAPLGAKVLQIQPPLKFRAGGA
jgi:hypothetical protein